MSIEQGRQPVDGLLGGFIKKGFLNQLITIDRLKGDGCKGCKTVARSVTPYAETLAAFKALFHPKDMRFSTAFRVKAVNRLTALARKRLEKSVRESA